MLGPFFSENSAKSFLHAFIAVCFNKGILLGIGLLKCFWYFCTFLLINISSFRLSLFRINTWNKIPVTFLKISTSRRICFSVIYKFNQRHWWSASPPSCSSAETARICPRRIFTIEGKAENLVTWDLESLPYITLNCCLQFSSYWVRLTLTGLGFEYLGLMEFKQGSNTDLPGNANVYFFSSENNFFGIFSKPL